MTGEREDEALCTMRLPDGRRLSWYELGDRTGTPCLFLPGSGTSGLAGRALDVAAAAHGIRLLSLDRPGLGHSDPGPRRALHEWVDDVEYLLDHLRIDRCGVVGHSAGGGFALAISQRLGERITRTVIGAGSPPYSEPWAQARGVQTGSARLTARLVVHRPRVHGRMYRVGIPRSARGADRLMRLYTHAPTEDGRFCRTHPDAGRAIFEAFADGYRGGSAGPTEDFATVCRPWGFDLDEVTGTVDWWHGERDGNVIPRSGREVIARLPHATEHVVSGGHLALFAHADEALAPLAAA